MLNSPKFTISVLAMNGLDMTRHCVESVLKHSKNFELLLTDNASDDGTAAYFDELEKKHANIRVRHNIINRGFSEPNNVALQEAQGTYFITLNNDAEVPRNWLALLEKPFKQHKDAAITGPIGSPCSFREPFPSFHGSAGPNLEYIEGSCLCIPTKLAKRIGLFAPYLHFAYAEDADLSLRVRARGLTIHQVPFTLVHHRSKTAQQVADIEEIQRRNHTAMVQRWGKYLEFRRFDLPFLVRRHQAIGDVLLTTPLIAELKRQNPRSEIFVETSHPEIFRDNPCVAKAGPDCSEIHRWATLIDLNMSYENQPETNIVDAYFNTAHIIQTRSPQLEIWPNPTEMTCAASLINTGRWVAIHPGPTTWAGKNWPWARWELLCRYLLAGGWKVVIVGNPEGLSLPNYCDLRGHTNFHELAATIGACEFFIGVDSFPQHVAGAMNIPSIVLFGASSPQFIFPKDTVKRIPVIGTARCAGERHRVTGQTFTDCDGACMQSISVNDVIEAIQLLTS